MAFFNSGNQYFVRHLWWRLEPDLQYGVVINLLEGYGNDNPGAKSQGSQAADGRRRCRSDRPSAYPSAVRPVQLSVTRCPFFQKRS